MVNHLLIKDSANFEVPRLNGMPAARAVLIKQFCYILGYGADDVFPDVASHLTASGATAGGTPAGAGVYVRADSVWTKQGQE
ncbi:MAG: hypothetical protein LBF78_14825 [Treponema sp.]|jgi:hypothetical protein|nr:hypothetical protein [Treponema sp.]